jgi:hypothetical protein
MARGAAGGVMEEPRPFQCEDPAIGRRVLVAAMANTLRGIISASPVQISDADLMLLLSSAGFTSGEITDHFGHAYAEAISQRFQTFVTGSSSDA